MKLMQARPVLVAGALLLLLLAADIQPAHADRAALGPIDAAPLPIIPAQAAARAGWSAWSSLDGMLTSAPSITASGADRLELFARDTQGYLVWRRWNGQNWSGWQQLGGGLASAPACASWGSGASIRISCFAIRSGSSSVWHTWYNGSNWTDWQDLGGIATSAPAAVSWAPGVVALFVRGSDDALYQRWFDGRGWHPWRRFDGMLTS
ncbi:MAG TPA: hypothetical protein PKC19_19025, partial [Roseiflexaceae bacterium]|nr:hypothetical protein [Roseiflexaceae bacterium]